MQQGTAHPGMSHGTTGIYIPPQRGEHLKVVLAVLVGAPLALALFWGIMTLGAQAVQWVMRSYPDHADGIFEIAGVAVVTLYLGITAGMIIRRSLREKKRHAKTMQKSNVGSSDFSAKALVGATTILGAEGRIPWHKMVPGRYTLEKIGRAEKFSFITPKGTEEVRIRELKFKVGGAIFRVAAPDIFMALYSLRAGRVYNVTIVSGSPILTLVE